MKWTAKQREFPDGVAWSVTAGDRTFEVEVAPGPDRLLRLERAVNQALGLAVAPPPAPPQWRVDERVHAGGGLYELEETTYWTVVDAIADQGRWQFSGTSSSSFQGGTWSGDGGSSGCDEVVLGADGCHVLSRDSDKAACHPLPIVVDPGPEGR